MGSRISQIWKAILGSWDALKVGLIKRLGNGQTTSIWNENWLPRSTRLRPVAPKAAHPPFLVSELIDATSSEWRYDILDEHFYPMDVEVIKSIPLTTANLTDSWVCHYERSGLFTVRSMYMLLVSTKKVREDWLEGRAASSSSGSEQKMWSKMWKTKVPSKIRVFLWKLAHQSLPMASVCHHRNMAPGCPFYAATNDNWRHSLMDCTTTPYVWALLDEELIEHITLTNVERLRNGLLPY
jgi:hypothetical protein